MKRRSPYFIAIALHYRWSPDPWTKNMDAPAVVDIHEELQAAGLIERVNGVWVGCHTPLKVYAQALGDVPLPVQTWVIPQTTKHPA